MLAWRTRPAKRADGHPGMAWIASAALAAAWRKGKVGRLRCWMGPEAAAGSFGAVKRSGT